MTHGSTIIIVGGAHGGPAAVKRARQMNEHARIILIEQSSIATWDRTSLKSQFCYDSEPIAERAGVFENSDYFAKRYNVEIRSNTKAVAIDVDSRCLIVETAKKQERLPYNSLVFAGGARSIELSVEGLAGPRVVHFRTPNDLQAIKGAMQNGAKHAVVVGCGFYGVEAALSLQKVGLCVAMVECKQRIMPRFSLQFAQEILEKLQQENISVWRNTTIDHACRREDGGFDLSLSSGETISTDLVVVCVGITPRTALLVKAGAAVDENGLIRVDDAMRTTLPDIFACGSAIAVPYAVTRERKWIPQPAIVLRTAQIAGHNAAINHETAKETIQPFCGTLIFEINDVKFARTGFNEQEACLEFGNDAILVTTVFGSTKESYVYQQEMCVKLIVERTSSRIVGGEVFGSVGVERRIDLLSVAVFEGWSPDRLLDVDMAFMANSAPAFDPLKDAAMRAKNALAENARIMSADMLALWLARNQDFQLVNVGESPVFSSHVPRKAIHVPLEKLRERMNEIADDGAPIVLCSKSGHRSYLAQQALQQRGHSNVYHLDGGIAAWHLVARKGED